MANNIIKGFAIAAGTGLAIGMGNNRKRVEVPANGAAPEDAPSEADPLDERVGRIENRLSLVETRPVPAADAARLAGIEERCDRKDREIAALRNQMREMRESVAEVAAVIQDKFAGVAREVPGMVDAAIRSRVAELRKGLAAEIQASVDAKLESFERTVDSKISARVAALEKGLVDQSGIITALSERALESDANLQRLISAVERLCERTEGRQPVAPASREDVPFEKQLTEAARRTPASAGVHPAFVKEDDAPKPRHRLSGYR